MIMEYYVVKMKVLYSLVVFNVFLTSVNFLSADNLCKQFGARLGLAECRMLVLFCILTVYHSDSVPERFFSKKLTENVSRQQLTTKACKMYPAFKEFKISLLTFK